MNRRIFVGLVTALFILSITGTIEADIPATNSSPEIATSHVFSLGIAIENGKIVQGYAIIHYKEGFGKPPWAGKPDGGTDDCYEFLARGAKWKTIEPYIVNPANTRGLDAGFIMDNLAVNIEKWEIAAGIEILGTGSATSETLVADTQSPDNRNEVYFADIAEPGAIAVTIVWGIFRGPPKQRELVEWDQIYDDFDFDWSATGESGKMDFENIATHELGHSVGLDDLYEERCSEQTMYGYADYGETKKRTLEAGDIAGVTELYS